MPLHYQLWNKTGKPLAQIPKIVLLHGMGGTGSLWRPVASGLEDIAAVLAPDQRGHGKSLVALDPDTKVGYAPRDYAQDLTETLDSLDFHPAWIVGHSMGVRTACAFAHLKPDWTSGLVLVDLGFSGVAGGGLGEELARFLQHLPMTFPSRDEARLYMQTQCPDPSIGQYLMAVSVKTPEGDITFPFDRNALIETINAARGVSLRDWIKETADKGKPVLVLRGARSQVWSHEEFEKEKGFFSEWASVKFLEIENAGHGLPFEQRLIFVTLLKKLLTAKNL